MNKYSWLIIIIFIAFTTQVSCKKKTRGATASNKEVKESTTAVASSLLDIHIDGEYLKPENTDPFTLTDKKIIGDILFLNVEYNGGCKDHVFTLNTHMRWLKTMPPQLNLYLEHENNDDNCRSVVSETLAFDLKAIRNSGTNTIKLIVDGDTENKLTYKY